MIAPKARRLFRAHARAVNADIHTGQDLERRRVERDAIDGDYALFDQPLGLAARGDAGAGEELRDALAFLRRLFGPHG